MTAGEIKEEDGRQNLEGLLKMGRRTLGVFRRNVASGQSREGTV